MTTGIEAATAARLEREKSKEAVLDPDSQPHGENRRVGIYGIDTSRGGMVWYKQSRDGQTPVTLTNFVALIRRETAIDDGVDVRREVTLRVTQDGQVRSINIPAEEFSGMKWPMRYLGSEYILTAGQAAADRAREAIQVLSKGGVQKREVFEHTGWREIGGKLHFLHGDGAINESGSREDVAVELPEQLEYVRLPTVPDAAGLWKSLAIAQRLVELAPTRIGWASLLANLRPAIAPPHSSLWVMGRTGLFKTEWQVLFGRTWGARLSADAVTQWVSTANALVALGFVAKDIALFIDDFVPEGTASHQATDYRKAGEVVRQFANRGARDRLNSEASIRARKKPRGGMISTGETSPRMQSANARLVIVEMDPSEADARKLTEAQKLEPEALPLFTAGFISWLAGDGRAWRDNCRPRSLELQGELTGGCGHNRIAVALAELLDTYDALAAFVAARAPGCQWLDQSMREEVVSILREIAGLQQAHQISTDPVDVFFRQLGAALSSGAAHVTTLEGEQPAEYQSALGWRFTDGMSRVPGGNRVGMVDGLDVYLIPESALKAARAIDPDAIGIPVNALGSRLKERGLLLDVEEEGRNRVKAPGCKGRFWKVGRVSLLDTVDGIQPDEGEGTCMSGNSGKSGTDLAADSHNSRYSRSCGPTPLRKNTDPSDIAHYRDGLDATGRTLRIAEIDELARDERPTEA